LEGAVNFNSEKKFENAKKGLEKLPGGDAFQAQTQTNGSH
jgi:hypothetical protein